MKRFPSKNRMREVKIFNSHNLASVTTQKVYICWHAAVRGRMSSTAKYQVVHIGHVTDPKAAWYDYGNKTFSAWQDKQKALAAAVAWANEKFGEREWVRDLWGSYQDSEALTKVWELVKAAKGATKTEIAEAGDK
jgi:hypothetical protein